jgi:HEAT repeat protein
MRRSHRSISSGRGLCYAWHPAAAPAVVHALGDDAWRVRQRAANVCRVREIGESAEVLAGLLTDPVPRVRAAAARAVAVVGEAEHAPPLRRLLTDADPAGAETSSVLLSGPS